MPDSADSYSFWNSGKRPLEHPSQPIALSDVNKACLGSTAWRTAQLPPCCCRFFVIVILSACAQMMVRQCSHSAVKVLSCRGRSSQCCCAARALQRLCWLYLSMAHAPACLAPQAPRDMQDHMGAGGPVLLAVSHCSQVHICGMGAPTVYHCDQRMLRL